MAVYAITGGNSGIGAELKRQLENQNDSVISVDINGGDIIADLSTSEGRRSAIEAISTLAHDGLDGFIPCAGLPPMNVPLSMVARVNYFAAVSMTEGLHSLVAKKRGTALLVASSSAHMIDSGDPFVQYCLGGMEEDACKHIESRDDHTAYAGSKRALTLWMRRNAVDFAHRGVRMNVIAPGLTLTPMTQQAYDDPNRGDNLKSFATITPWGSQAAEPSQIANVMRFMLSKEASFVCGSVFVVDGGTDAKLRSDSF